MSPVLRWVSDHGDLTIILVASALGLLVAGSSFISSYTYIPYIVEALPMRGEDLSSNLDIAPFAKVQRDYSQYRSLYVPITRPILALFGMNYSVFLVVYTALLVIYGLVVRRMLAGYGADPATALAAALLSVSAPIALYSTWTVADYEIPGAIFLYLMLLLLPGLSERPSARLWGMVALVMLAVFTKETYRAVALIFLVAYTLFLRKPGQLRWLALLMGLLAAATFLRVPVQEPGGTFNPATLAVGSLHSVLQLFALVGAGTIFLVALVEGPRAPGEGTRSRWAALEPLRAFGALLAQKAVLGVPLLFAALLALAWAAPISDFSSYLKIVVFSDGSLPWLIPFAVALLASLLWVLFLSGSGWDRFCAACVLGMTAAAVLPATGLLGARTDVTARSFLAVAPLAFYLVARGGLRLWRGPDGAAGSAGAPLAPSTDPRARFRRVAVGLGVALIVWTTTSTIAADAVDYRAQSTATQLTKESFAPLDLRNSTVLITNSFNPVFPEEVWYLSGRPPRGMTWRAVNSSQDAQAVVSQDSSVCLSRGVYLYHVSDEAAASSPNIGASGLWSAHTWISPLAPYLAWIDDYFQTRLKTSPFVRWAVENGEVLSDVRRPSADFPRWPGLLGERLLTGRPVWLPMDVRGLLVDVTEPLKAVCQAPVRPGADLNQTAPTWTPTPTWTPNPNTTE